MAYPLFTRVVLREDLPEYQLYRGDVATIVDQHEGGEGEETGYSLEVFNAVGETIAVIVVAESKIEPLKKNEIFHVRRLDELAAA
ncbi:MAG: DUF4926 domain-containing protein [bacterium]|nr:DUF4926 domain-containing protein [bacterium]